MRRSCLFIRVSSLPTISSSSWDGSLTPRSRCMILPRIPGPPEGPAVEVSVPSSPARISTAGSRSCSPRIGAVLPDSFSSSPKRRPCGNAPVERGRENVGVRVCGQRAHPRLPSENTENNTRAPSWSKLALFIRDVGDQTHSQEPECGAIKAPRCFPPSTRNGHGRTAPAPPHPRRCSAPARRSNLAAATHATQRGEHAALASQWLTL